MRARTWLVALSMSLAGVARAQQPPAPAPTATPSASAPADAAAAATAPAATATTSTTAPQPAADGEYERSDDRRTLNGHTFVPAFDVRWPFATTSFQSDLIVGLGRTETTFTIGSKTYDGTFEYAGIGGVLAYEYGFMKYFSVRAALEQQMFSGINGKSALAVGTEVQFGFGVGATASTQIGDSIRAGVLFDYAVRPNAGLQVANGIKTIVDSCNAGSCNVDLGELFVVQNVSTFQPALAVSWAPARALGVTANAAYIHANGEKTNSGSGDAGRLSAAMDFDLLKVSSVPVGLLVQFAWTAPFNGESTLQHVTDLGGGIMYTGRKDLSAGIEFVNRRFSVAPNVDVSWKTYLAAIGLRYFW